MLGRRDVDTCAVDAVRVVAQTEEALQVVVLAGGDRRADCDVRDRRHRAENRDAIAIARGDVEVPHPRLLADRGELQLPLLDPFPAPLGVLILRPQREPFGADFVERQPDDVVGGGLEDPVGPLLGQPREAHAGRQPARGHDPDVRVERVPKHAERLGGRGRADHREGIVVGHALGHQELGRAIVVVVRSIAHVQVDEARWARDERQVDGRRPRFTLHGRPRQRRRRGRRVDRLRNDGITRVLSASQAET